MGFGLTFLVIFITRNRSRAIASRTSQGECDRKIFFHFFTKNLLEKIFLLYPFHPLFFSSHFSRSRTENYKGNFASCSLSIFFHLQCIIKAQAQFFFCFFFFTNVTSQRFLSKIYRSMVLFLTGFW